MLSLILKDMSVSMSESANNNSKHLFYHFYVVILNKRYGFRAMSKNLLTQDFLCSELGGLEWPEIY